MADSSPEPRTTPAPTRLDRAALERILARASELQVRSGETTEEFTEDQLLELGSEVGLSAQHLRQALAEERTRSSVPDDEHGLVVSVFGPSRVRASRTVPGKAADLLADIDAWMRQEEMLIVKRHHADRIVWEPRKDFLVGVTRALHLGGRDYTLSHCFEASATVIQVDDDHAHVGLDADFRSMRRHAAGSVLGATAVGAAATTALFIINALAAVAVAPVIVAPVIGIAGARAMQGRVVTRAQLALEQLLDRLERGDLASSRRRPQSFLGAIVAAANAPLRRL